MSDQEAVMPRGLVCPDSDCEDCHGVGNADGDPCRFCWPIEDDEREALTDE